MTVFPVETPAGLFFPVFDPGLKGNFTRLSGIGEGSFFDVGFEAAVGQADLQVMLKRGFSFRDVIHEEGEDHRGWNGTLTPSRGWVGGAHVDGDAGLVGDRFREVDPVAFGFEDDLFREFGNIFAAGPGNHGPDGQHLIGVGAQGTLVAGQGLHGDFQGGVGGDGNIPANQVATGFRSDFHREFRFPGFLLQEQGSGELSAS